MSEPVTLVCYKCGKSHPEVVFRVRSKQCNSCRGKVDRARSNASEQSRDRTRNHRARYANSDKGRLKLRELHVQNKYGLSPESYLSLYQAQKSCCAICKKSLLFYNDGTGAEVAKVDHDHATAEVRGLLCGNCNAAIGLMFDDPQILESAISYLKFYKE